MLQRGLLTFFAILLPLGIFATGHASAPAQQRVTTQIATFPIVVTVQSSANVRSGPGTEFPIISAARPGQRLNVYGCNLDCSWYLLADNCWIAAFLVEPEQPIIPATGGNGQMPNVVVSVPITVPGSPLQRIRCPQTAVDIVTYAGPATFYPVVDSRPAGECVAIVGRNTAGDWYQLSHGMWIDAAAVIYAEPLEFIPITDKIFTPTPVLPPTPIPPFTFSAEEQAYIDFMAQQMATYAAAWATLEGQLALAEENLLVLQTSDWRSQTDAAIAVVRRTSEVIRSRIPPPRLVSVHAEYLVVADYYDEATVFVVEGITLLDLSRFDLARKCVALAIAAIARAQVILASINQGQIVVQVAAVATAIATPTPTPLPTYTSVATATPTAVPDLSEITTVGEWVLSSQERKGVNALLWTQRLMDADMITGDAEAYAVELYACVERSIGGTSDLFGESYPIYDVAGGCAQLLEQES